MTSPSDSSLESLQSHAPHVRLARRRLSWRGELLLAVLPTVVVLGVLALVELMSNQRLLFASLASSAFLIYLDPNHGANRVRTLILSQLLAAGVGFAMFSIAPYPYMAAAVAMVVTIFAMILLDAVHPPAIGTALAFAFKSTDSSNLAIFAMAVAMTAVLVGLQRAGTWTLVYLFRREQDRANAVNTP